MIINGDGGCGLVAGLWLKPAGLIRRSAAAYSAVLYSSREPSELSQWLCHDDSIINTRRRSRERISSPRKFLEDHGLPFGKF